MMGAEPLEVPHQSSATEHQHQQTSLIPPSTLVEDGCWDTSSNTNKLANLSHHQVNGGQSQGSSSSSGAKGARRTRHRVDAGEPRGCFNSANNPTFGFQPRNIFTSPLSQQKTGIGSPLVANNSNSGGGSNLSPFHLHHHPPPNPHFLHHHNPAFFPGFNKTHQQEGQDAYYFQPMKMLSEYITSQQAAAAAAAAAAISNSPPSNGQIPHQLLLREMLSKSSRNNNNNNNNNVTKCGYEEDVVSVMEQQQQQQNQSENNRPEVEKEDCDLRTGRGGGEDGAGDADRNEFMDSEDETEGARGKLKPVKLETLMENGSIAKGHPMLLVNGHGGSNSVEVGSGSASSSVTSGNSGANSGGGMRINGANKRKLYQPQQRSDFDEHEEEELDDDEYDANVMAEAAALVRTTKRLKESTRSSPNLGSGGNSPIAPNTDIFPPEEEENEEEEMRRMLKSDQHDYDDDQFDDDEELATSNRTTPNVNGKQEGMNLSSVNAAPLTRQLLTERSSNKEHGKASPSSMSILRTSASPKIMMNNGLNQGANMRRRESQQVPEMFMDLPFGAGVGPNPASYFYQWKENFKSTLITHINELVDTQFSLLFPNGQGQIQGNHHREGNMHPRNPNNSANPMQNQNQQREPMRMEKIEKIPLQQKNPASLLLNGGIVCNNNNNNNRERERDRERELCSPPPEKMARLDRNSNKEFFQGRIPFQVAGNFPRDRDMNNISNTPNKLTLGQLQQQQHQQHQQNFSSALMGLSQAAQMQHHQAVAAAAAAAGLNADMFENDAPISLVVNRDHITPRKRRHKVTDTRLTPRAVSRLLGQVDTYGGDLSPVREGRTPPPMSTPQGQGQQSLQTSVAIPNPSLSDSARLFTPYAHPLFGHHPPGSHHRLGSSPPMGIHPAILANPAEYVQQLREMSEQRNGELSLLRERERERDSGRNEHVRPVRESGSLAMERGGNGGARPNSAGSDSGETNSLLGDIPGSIYSMGTSHSSSSTLTPMHLRKAKLMFFWVRYPSSSVIKMYFPDIKFNKNNTAQLVKWFSNFREFYYIQMEKYARQALSEGIKNAEDLHVTVDNELYRVLNLHYNRNNHIEVPSNFRYVVEQTLREFFKAIQQGKDQEQSWKKAIYKQIIARLDDPVPEYFKSPNFLEQLE